VVRVVGDPSFWQDNGLRCLKVNLVRGSTSADFAFYLALYASVGQEPKHIMAWWHFWQFQATFMPRFS